MPKLKTHKGTAKRIKRTPAGKILRGNAAMNHFKMKQTRRGKRAKVADSNVKGKNAKSVRQALGI
ncbi:50S ribosomal protein L35 [Candidatus Saccharibacteria bacterium]|nr:50S ribosomal protein L35 [Candidatus Saccharibacteria bacterium]